MTKLSARALCLLMLAGFAPSVRAFVDAVADAKAKDAPKQLEKDKDKKLTTPPKFDLFASPLMGPQFPAAFNPNMMGDYPGAFASRPSLVTGQQTITTTTVVTAVPPIVTTTTTTRQVTLNRNILVAGPSPVAFKISENFSARPQDRAFVTYNFFGAVRGPQGGMNEPLNTTETTVTMPAPNVTVTTTVSTVFPPAPIPRINIHRELAGFEKTFLDGFASVEFRVPVIQQNSNLPEFGFRNVGDLTVIGKYAFLLDRETGDVFSGGLAVTAPTGPGVTTKDGYVHSTLLQPWFGYIHNFDRFYVQGFHAGVFPTDVRDVALLFNDASLSYWLYRAAGDRPLRYIVPTVEAHVTTPLNHRDGKGPLFIPDLVVMTGGVHFGLFRNTNFSVGVATPVTGPRIYNIEAFAQLNWRF